MSSSTSVFQIVFKNTSRNIFFHIQTRCYMMICKLYILVRWFFKLCNSLLYLICLNSSGTKYLCLLLIVKSCKRFCRFLCNLIFLNFSMASSDRLFAIVLYSCTTVLLMFIMLASFSTSLPLAASGNSSGFSLEALTFLLLHA